MVAAQIFLEHDFALHAVRYEMEKSREKLPKLEKVDDVVMVSAAALVLKDEKKRKESWQAVCKNILTRPVELGDLDTSQAELPPLGRAMPSRKTDPSSRLRSMSRGAASSRQHPLQDQRDRDRRRPARRESDLRDEERAEGRKILGIRFKQHEDGKDRAGTRDRDRGRSPQRNRDARTSTRNERDRPLHVDSGPGVEDGPLVGSHWAQPFPQGSRSVHLEASASSSSAGHDQHHARGAVSPPTGAAQRRKPRAPSYPPGARPAPPPYSPPRSSELPRRRVLIPAQPVASAPQTGTMGPCCHRPNCVFEHPVGWDPKAATKWAMEKAFKQGQADAKAAQELAVSGSAASGSHEGPAGGQHWMNRWPDPQAGEQLSWAQEHLEVLKGTKGGKSFAQRTLTQTVG